MKIAIIYNKNIQTEKIVEQFKRISPFEFLTVENVRECDLIISFGGDGTTLKCVPYALESGKPIVAVNTGNIGFLTTYSSNDIQKIINDLTHSKIIYDEKPLLECEIDRKKYYALNEFVLERNHTEICETNLFSLSFDGQIVNNYYADGIIVATQTGATGYSFSAGGPILQPNLKANVVTVICSRSTKGASIVVKQETEISIKAERATHPCNLFCDGIFLRKISAGKEILIKKSNKTIKLAKTGEFFSLLNKKILG